MMQEPVTIILLQIILQGWCAQCFLSGIILVLAAETVLGCTVLIWKELFAAYN
jgi:hypothetical protein